MFSSVIFFLHNASLTVLVGLPHPLVNTELQTNEICILFAIFQDLECED